MESQQLADTCMLKTIGHIHPGSLASARTALPDEYSRGKTQISACNKVGGRGFFRMCLESHGG